MYEEVVTAEQRRQPRLFAQPLIGPFVYPCSLADIKGRLTSFPYEDLEGLWAGGLTAATRKNGTAHGRYVYGPRPTIHLCSYPEDFRFKQPAHVKRSDIERGLWVELQYGMRVRQVGSRWLCEWEPDTLRRFMLNHVLAHEVGHHVYFWQRHKQGLIYHPHTRECEQFAEAYALRQKPSRMG